MYGHLPPRILTVPHELPRESSSVGAACLPISSIEWNRPGRRVRPPVVPAAIGSAGEADGYGASAKASSAHRSYWLHRHHPVTAVANAPTSAA